MMFLDCPAYLDEDGAVRCGLPAEVNSRFVMNSTDGPLESAMIRCPAGHRFNGPIEFLTWNRTDKHDPGAPPATSSARRTGRHDRPGPGRGSAVRQIAAVPTRDISRPVSAPAYYLGRPADLWIAALRPGRRRTASDHPVGARRSA